MNRSQNILARTILLCASVLLLLPADVRAAGKALRLDGDGDYVSLVQPLPDLASLTLEAWIFYQGDAQSRVLFMDATCDGGNDFLINITSTSIGVRADKAGGTLFYERSAAVGGLDLVGGWHHVAWVLTANQSLIYLDGGLIATKNESGSNVGYHARTPSLGYWYDECRDPLSHVGHNTFFAGLIDEFRIWNRALGREELRAHMSRTLSGREEGLVVYYSFDGLMPDGKVPDLSGNGRHGTLVGDAGLVAAGPPGPGVEWAPELGVVPAVADLDSSQQEVEVQLANRGTGTLVWAVEETATWLTIASGQGNTLQDSSFSGVGETVLEMRANRSGLKAGTYETRVQIQSNGGGAEVPVRLQVVRGPGAQGKALTLDRDGDWMRVRGLGLRYEDLTVEAWVRLVRSPARGQEPNVLGLQGGALQLGLAGVGSDVPDAVRFDGHGKDPSRLTTAAHLIQAESWHHLAAVTTLSGSTIYLDGVRVAHNQFRASATEVVDGDLVIGRDPDATTGFWPGQIDELRIWDRALGVEELRNNMFRRLTGEEPGLAVYYDFDRPDASGRVPDLSGHGRYGEAQGDARLAESTVYFVDEPGAPVMALSPAEIRVDSTAQQTAVEVRNTGTGRLTWTIGEAAVWMEVWSLQGNTAGGEEFFGTGCDTLIVRTSGSGLNPGVYQSYIRIRSSGGDVDLPVRMTIAGSTPLPREPTPIPEPSGFRILAIADVPNDRGRQIRITWHRHPNDREDAYPQVTAYGVWREFDPELAAVRPKPVASNYGTYPEGEWTFVGEVPARGVETYSYEAPTLADSTAHSGVYYSIFFVSARTTDPNTQFDCLPDSGYSVDNLIPATPEFLAGAVFGDQVKLVWRPVLTEGIGYAVYRGVSSSFEPQTIHQITLAPRFAETYDPQQPFYRVAALVVSGAVGPLSETVEVRPFTSDTAQPEDFDGDSRVSLADFFLLADALGSAESRFDLDGNGVVDLRDFLLFADGFGAR